MNWPYKKVTNLRNFRCLTRCWRRSCATKWRWPSRRSSPTSSTTPPLATPALRRHQTWTCRWLEHRLATFDAADRLEIDRMFLSLPRNLRHSVFNRKFEFDLWVNAEFKKVIDWLNRDCIIRLCLQQLFFKKKNVIVMNDRDANSSIFIEAV